AQAFNSMQATLVDVAHQQVDVLRRGVSDIFVTMARRNRSLIDRQLAMLDEFEAEVEDPEVLAHYYQLDHMATRMRRNSESLLVLANAEPKRRRVKATEIDDVVRASIGEVEDYRRIEIEALESLQVRGNVVADISHLLAELLENAVQFSPPSEPVRVTGLFESDGYQVTVSDRGVGMTEARVAELNRILEKPPVLGLSVEPTLGMYVVSKLAHRHGVKVELIRGVPGITARVTVPRNHLEAVDKAQIGNLERDRRRARSAPDPDDYDDAATRDYILKHTATEAEPAPVASAEPDRVIDLTREHVEDELTPASPSAGGLPIRNPGQSLGDDDSSAPATGPGEGAVGIKSALSAFDAGRRAAEVKNDDEDDDRERH
ncbi:MAG TPA: ATP-binding protein, partial [Acidimicrobiia bacterium]